MDRIIHVTNCTDEDSENGRIPGGHRWFTSDPAVSKIWIEPFWSQWKPLCTVADVRGCSGWDDGNSTWDSSGLCGCSEDDGAGLRLALLIRCNHVNLVLCIPLQAAQHHILTALGKADLWFPVRHEPLRKKCGGYKTQNRVTKRECGHSLQAQREGSF